MATYNRAHLIKKTLQSIQNQTFGNFECIIIDDTSQDKTKEVVEKFIGEDNRYNYFLRNSKYQKGLSGCRNMGLDLAHGEWVIFFDDDDLVHPQNLEIALKAGKELKCDYVHYRKSNYNFFNERVEYDSYSLVESIDNTQLLKVLNNYYGISSCSVLWRREMFNNLRFNENLKYAEEWALFTKIISIKEYHGVFIDNILYYNKKHPDSNTGRYFSHDLEMINSHYEAIRSVAEHLKLNFHLNWRIKYFLLNYTFQLNNRKLIIELIEIISSNSIELYFWNLYCLTLPIKVKLIRKIS